MTVREAKAFVKGRHPRACWGLLLDTRTGREWFYVWDGTQAPGATEPRWGKGDTLGAAWKAAAEAIGSSR